jgi:hypothetical protein
MKMEENQKREDPSVGGPGVEDPFSRFMFGPGRRIEELPPQRMENGSQSSIDFEELMVNFDRLTESVQNLKPLFRKFLPLMEQFWKKNERG